MRGRREGGREGGREVYNKTLKEKINTRKKRKIDGQERIGDGFLFVGVTLLVADAPAGLLCYMTGF